MLYRLLGYAIWNLGRLWLRRRYGAFVPGRRGLAAGAVVLAIASLAVAGARREARS
jgi:hypothetical protein